MKKILCAVMLVLLVCSGAWANVRINAENFPDGIFRKYISDNFDNGDGVLTDDEISAITEIRVPMLGDIKFQSIKGIEFFSDLEWLSVPNMEITSIDLSGNTKLVSFDCQQNSLSELDLSRNTELRTLFCRDNKLARLDLSSNTKISNIDVAYNQLRELNISSNTELERLACQGNLLTELDLSGKTKLTSLYCAQNRLITLDVSSCTALKSISIGQNSLAAFDLPFEVSLPVYVPNPIVPHSSYAAKQSIEDELNFTYNEGDSYPYALDLREYMSSSQVSNIIYGSVQGFDEEDKEISTIYENGTAKFAAPPTTVSYKYDTFSKLSQSYKEKYYDEDMDVKIPVCTLDKKPL